MGILHYDAFVSLHSRNSMTRQATVTHFVAVSDLSQPATSQEGILIEVTGRGGDTPGNRAKALAIAQKKWETGEIAAEKFPEGLTLENIAYVPPESAASVQKPPKLPPLIQGAQEILELTKLQLEVQQIAVEAEPYLPIIQAVLQGTRPFTAKEKELVQDKHFSKTLERFAATLTKQEQYRDNSPGYGKLVLNALAWQLGKGVKEPAQTQKKRQPVRTTARKSTDRKRV